MPDLLIRLALVAVFAAALSPLLLVERLGAPERANPCSLLMLIACLAVLAALWRYAVNGGEGARIDRHRLPDYSEK